MKMHAIALTPTFTKSLSRLTAQEQAAVKQLPTEFMMNPEAPGLRLHKLNCREARFASLSVNMDLRVIVLKDGAQVIFCYVGHHDDAYRWAERRRVETHPITGAAQLVEIEEVIREEERGIVREVSAPLFADESDDYLLSLGVPPAWMGVVKGVDEDGLYAILERLPEEAAEALVTLVTGGRPVPALPTDEETAPADPFAHPDARRRFWVASDELALKTALDAPWERWIVFLHPSQRAAVERNFGSPARVSGGAGTGKTVVALHRAAHLVRLSDSARVLLTTYSRPLVDHLERGLDLLLGASGDARRRVHVEHLHQYAHQIVKESGSRFVPLRFADLSRFIADSMTDHPDTDVSAEFLRAEFDAVIDYWGVRDWATYRDIARTGRGSALSPARRKRLWPVFEGVLRRMHESGRMSWADLADAARQTMETHRDRPFRHVVVDEAQDFGPRELRFLMTLAPPGPSSHLFAGDVGQRIYRYPFSWLRAGVDIRGRGARLIVNYRTTAQIKRFAEQALGTVEPVDDSEEAGERSAVSLLSGPDPVVAGYEDAADEVAGWAVWLRALVADGVSPREIALFARTRALLEVRAAVAVDQAGLGATVLGDRAAETQGNAVTLGTLHQAKGLEFRAVGLVGCGADVLPHPSALAAADDAEGEAVARGRERQLFYVGCTRARDCLRIAHTGPASPLLSPHSDVYP